MTSSDTAFDRGIQLATAQAETFRHRFEMLKDLSLTQPETCESRRRPEKGMISLSDICRSQSLNLAFDRCADVGMAVSIHHGVTPASRRTESQGAAVNSQRPR